MKNLFTLNDLILNAYCESEGIDKEGLKISPPVNEGQMGAMKEIMDSEMWHECQTISPEKRIIDNIMNYSRALNVLKTEKSGNFNLLMN